MLASPSGRDTLTEHLVLTSFSVCRPLSVSPTRGARCRCERVREAGIAVKGFLFFAFTFGVGYFYIFISLFQRLFPTLEKINL